METLYRKVGNKYEPAGYSGVPDLYDGVWMVQRRQHSKSTSGLLWRIGEIPMADMNLFASLFKHDDEMSSYLLKLTDEKSDEFKEVVEAGGSFVKERLEFYNWSANDLINVLLRKLGTLIQSEREENFSEVAIGNHRKQKLSAIKKNIIVDSIIDYLMEDKEKTSEILKDNFNVEALENILLQIDKNKENDKR